MPSTAADMIQRLREAIVEALDIAPAITAITGRASGNLVPWRDIADTQLPLVAFHLLDFPQTGESRDTRDGDVQFTAVADGDDAASVANALLQAVEATLTAPALFAAGVDAAPMLFDRSSGDEDDVGNDDGVRIRTRNLHQEILRVRLTMTQ